MQAMSAGATPVENQIGVWSRRTVIAHVNVKMSKYSQQGFIIIVPQETDKYYRPGERSRI